MKKYWIVNEDFKDAVTAAKKLAKAEDNQEQFVILTDLEYKTISNQQAMIVIQRSDSE